MEINNSLFSLKVKVELTSKKSKTAVEELLERLVPVNMLITVILKYNQHQTLKLFTHQQLQTYTYQQLREEVLTNGN